MGTNVTVKLRVKNSGKRMVELFVEPNASEHFIETGAAVDFVLGGDNDWPIDIELQDDGRLVVTTFDSKGGYIELVPQSSRSPR